MSTRWKPAVTVAAVIERAGRFLMVEERTPDGIRINQPAGHLEAGESLIQAVVREVLEETAHGFDPQAMLGVYLWRSESAKGGHAYLRVAFCGAVGETDAGRALDDGILRTLWMSADELRADTARHRSPLVMRCVDDFLVGRRLPLDAVYAHRSALALQ